MLVSQGQLLLSVLLQQRIRAPENQKNPKTCLSYYAEEIQDIIAHLQNTGVENLARIWLSSTKRPQILAEDHKTLALAAAEATGERKAKLGKEEEQPDEEEDDDSDWDDQQSSQQSSTGFDMSELSENMCREFSDIIPSNLTSGPRNLLYYYVELEVGEGMFLAPVLNGYCDSIIDTFRKTCILIHRTLQNTKKFRQILANEGNKLNRSLVAVQEQGVLITAKMNNDEIVEFWVVGRLFSNPSRELYVCHKIDAPQNMVEMAFRLCMSCAG
jgi:hypothetical protein